MVDLPQKTITASYNLIYKVQKSCSYSNTTIQSLLKFQLTVIPFAPICRRKTWTCDSPAHIQRESSCRQKRPISHDAVTSLYSAGWGAEGSEYGLWSEDSLSLQMVMFWLKRFKFRNDQMMMIYVTHHTYWLRILLYGSHGTNKTKKDLEKRNFSSEMPLFIAPASTNIKRWSLHGFLINFFRRSLTCLLP